MTTEVTNDTSVETKSPKKPKRTEKKTVLATPPFFRNYIIISLGILD